LGYWVHQRKGKLQDLENAFFFRAEMKYISTNKEFQPAQGGKGMNFKSNNKHKVQTKQQQKRKPTKHL